MDAAAQVAASSLRGENVYEQTLLNKRRANAIGRKAGSPRNQRSWMPPGAQFQSADVAAVHWRERGQPNRWWPAEAKEECRP
jgi:hypothetical protein